MQYGVGLIRRVQARGQVTIPEVIRQTCEISAGSDLLFVQLGPGRFECRRLPSGSLEDFLDAVSGDGLAPDVASLREEMGDELYRGLR